MPPAASFGLPFRAVGRQALSQVLLFLSVFAVLFGVLKLNQYLFFYLDTSPAVILIPTGISLAIVYLGGYRLWLPIVCAWFLVTITSPLHLPLLAVAAITVAYPLQAVIGGYVLTRLNFLGTLQRTRDALILVAMALLLPIVAPSIVSGVQWAAGALPAASIWATWSRAWAGGVMNIMVFTPLITTWYLHRAKKTPKELAESATALLVLALAVYIVFWTTLPQVNVFIVLYLLFAIMFWIGLRLHPRVVAAAIFLVSALGMAGSIIAHPSITSLNAQLFADELFIILIAPIFLILTALVEERRARAWDLEEVNRKLSLEDRAKTEFLATLAHELRNPLAPIFSSLELIKIKALELSRPELVELADVASAHSATLTNLLDDLLDISRISHKKFKLRKESVDLRSIITRAIRAVDVSYASKNHRFSALLPEGSLWVEADPLRLEQILVNLLNNAAKYTPPGGDITLSVAFDAEKGVRISVKDSGIGIEPHMLRKIFESFIQTNDGSAGLGIGLSLTKRLVELHGGEVWAESGGLGKGSEFVVVLPGAHRLQLPLAASAPERRSGTGPAKAEKPAGPYRILIVDDNQAAADALVKLLSYGGHSVSAVYDGAAALQTMRGAEAQVVLLDIGLPGMDGYAVARSLREEHGYNPLVLVALTGYGQEEDKIKAQRAGFNYHLTKPVSIANVEAVLAKLNPR